MAPFQVLTRRVPYDGENLPLALARVARGEHRPATPQGCSWELMAILDDCLRADPALRPSFAELDRRLASLDPDGIKSPAFAARNPSGSGSLMMDRFPRHVAEALMAGEKVPPEAKPMVC